MRDFQVLLYFTLATRVLEESSFSQALKFRRTCQPIPDNNGDDELFTEERGEE